MNTPVFCALDLETTGLDYRLDQILSIGMVVFTKTTILAEREILVKHARYSGDAFALQMNAGLLKRLATEKGGDGVFILKDPDGIRGEVEWFLDGVPIQKPHPVGFNVGPFDLQFLRSVGAHDLFHHRCIELGSVFADESGAPGTSNSVIERLINKKVAHGALEDARDAAKLYQNRLRGVKEW